MGLRLWLGMSSQIGLRTFSQPPQRSSCNGWGAESGLPCLPLKRFQRQASLIGPIMVETTVTWIKLRPPTAQKHFASMTVAEARGKQVDLIWAERNQIAIPHLLLRKSQGDWKGTAFPSVCQARSAADWWIYCYQACGRASQKKQGILLDNFCGIIFSSGRPKICPPNYVHVHCFQELLLFLNNILKTCLVK